MHESSMLLENATALHVAVIVLNLNEPVTFACCAWAPRDQIDVRWNINILTNMVTIDSTSLPSLTITKVGHVELGPNSLEV